MRRIKGMVYRSRHTLLPDMMGAAALMAALVIGLHLAPAI